MASGRAYVAGFGVALAAGAGFVIEMDADFSHDPADLPRLLAAAREGADLALGSRYVPGGGIENWSGSRRLISRAGCLYARAVLGVGVRDLTGGFKCFRASALEAIDYRSVRSLGYAFQVELTYRALRRGLRGARGADRVPRAPRGRVEDDRPDRAGGRAVDPTAAWRSCSRPHRPINLQVKPEEMALVRGIADTKQSLRDWQARPGSVLVPWSVGSLATAIMLLTATWLVATQTTPDLSPLYFPGVAVPAEFGDYGFVLFRNSLVLALHSLACVAGFIAGSSLPQVAQGHSGLWRWIHDKAGPLAIGFVVCATLFSLTTQAFILGSDTATLAFHLDMSPAMFLAVLSLHAVPELFALFLPLAAWTMASRRGRWDELLAATFVTTAIAIPILLAAGAVEVWVTPLILRELGA